MATVHGTHEFGTGGLEGIAKYFRQRARSVKKPHKKDAFEGMAINAECAADRIVDLEHFKARLLQHPES